MWNKNELPNTQKTDFNDVFDKKESEKKENREISSDNQKIY
jgi:hypothetical protein